MSNYKPDCKEFLFLLKHDSSFFIKRYKEMEYWEIWAGILGEQRYLNLYSWQYDESARAELLEFIDFIDNNGFIVSRRKNRGGYWNFYIIVEGDPLENLY